jgi:UDP-N-acetylmuramate: L-alanyl-gamma-D-glutamyl-meso-diaminopimelate ligase
LILTSLEFDHADIFSSIEEIKDQFKEIIPLKNPIIANMSYPATRDLKKEMGGEWIKLDLPEIAKMDSEGCEFKLQGETFKTNLVGGHNILNLTSAILFALSEGIGIEKIKNAVRELNLVKRRQEVRGFYKGAMVIDDFAHHPRSVAMTFEGISTRYPGKEIIVVLEPASATARSHIFQNEFAQAISAIPQVLLAKPGDTTVKGGENLDLLKLAGTHENATVVEDLTSLRQILDDRINKNSLLLILSNSTCLGLWESDFVKQLKSGV